MVLLKNQRRAHSIRTQMNFEELLHFYPFILYEVTMSTPSFGVLKNCPKFLPFIIKSISLTYLDPIHYGTGTLQ